MGESKYWIMGLLVLGIIVIGLVLAINAGDKNDASDQPGSVSVTGNSEFTVSPDKVELYARIETKDFAAKDAKDKNAEISDKVIAALKRAGVKSDDIETASFSLSPEYEWNYTLEKSEFKGYTVQHSLKITTDDLDKAGDLIDVAVDAGANGVDNIIFKLKPETEKKVKDEAMVKAATAAKEKAIALAGTLGIKLGKVTYISESNYYYEPYNYRTDYSMMTKEMSGGAPATQIEPQKLQISAQVSVNFEIED